MRRSVFLSLLVGAGAVSGCGQDLLDPAEFKYEVLPDDTASPDTALGDTALDDTALGDTALGDTALGDTALGDTALGDTQTDTAINCAVGEACEDGNKCTSTDKCNAAGICVGGPLKACDDGDVCTDDTCDASDGTCKSTENSASCDDGSKCTKDTVCEGGKCLGGKPTGACACQTNADCASANGGDMCAGTWICDGATNSCAVQPSTVVVCDKSADSDCVKTQCEPTTAKCAPQNMADETSCDDGDVCTLTSACKGGVCLPGATTSCDDNNACTADTCAAKSGCAHLNLPSGATCTDGDSCTVADACTAGSCTAGKATVCDDSNACSADSCNQATGACVHIPNPLAKCDDNNACTADDNCTGGGCSGTSKSCDDASTCTADSCDPTTGACVFTAQNSACDDKDVCTDDLCAPAHEKAQKPDGCAHLANAATCTDDDLCTVDSTCDAGKCATPGATNCDDGNSCTADSCDPKLGCSSTAASSTCGDGDPCTGPGQCKDAKCLAGAPQLWTLQPAGAGQQSSVSGVAVSGKRVAVAGSIQAKDGQRAALWTVGVDGGAEGTWTDGGTQTSDALRPVFVGQELVVPISSAAKDGARTVAVTRLSAALKPVWTQAASAKGDTEPAPYSLTQVGAEIVSVGRTRGALTDAGYKLWLLRVGADGKNLQELSFALGGDSIGHRVGAGANAGQLLVGGSVSEKPGSPASSLHTLVAVNGTLAWQQSVAHKTHRSCRWIGLEGQDVLAVDVINNPSPNMDRLSIVRRNGQGKLKSDVAVLLKLVGANSLPSVLVDPWNGGWLVAASESKAQKTSGVLQVVLKDGHHPAWTTKLGTSAAGLVALDAKRFLAAFNDGADGAARANLAALDPFGAATCATGKCLGLAVNSCDDGNPCSTDRCDEKTGCAHDALNGGICPDGHGCLLATKCAAGKCTGEPRLFAKVHGKPGEIDAVTAVTTLPDGRIVTFGGRGYLSRFTVSGTHEWTKQSNASDSWGHAVTAIGAQPVTVALVSPTGVPTAAKVRVQRHTAAGDVVWGKLVSNGPDNWPRNRSVRLTSAGDIQFVGWTGVDFKAEKMWRVRLGPDGAIKENAAISVGTRSFAYSSAEDALGRTWLGGAAILAGEKGYKGVALALDAAGKVVAKHVLDTPGDRHLLAIQPQPDGSVIALGRGDNNHNAYPTIIPFFVLKIGADSSVQWHKQPFGTKQFFGLMHTDAIVLSNGDFAVTAENQTGVAANGFGARISASGLPVWVREKKQSAVEGQSRGVTEAPDGNLVFVSAVTEKTGKFADVGLIRVDAFGGETCGEGNCAQTNAQDCDDSNPCTVDTCDPKSGCKSDAAKDGQPCQGDACALSNVCKTGKCDAGKPRNWLWTDGAATAKEEVTALTADGEQTWAGGEVHGGAAGGVDFGLWRLSADGTKLAGKTFGTIKGDYLRALAALSDGGAVAVGRWGASDFAGTGGDGAILRVDATGAQKWLATPDASATVESLDAVLAEKSGVVACGFAQSNGREQAWLTGVDAAGKTTLDRLWPAGHDARCRSVVRNGAEYALLVWDKIGSGQLGLIGAGNQGQPLWRTSAPVAGANVVPGLLWRGESGLFAVSSRGDTAKSGGALFSRFDSRGALQEHVEAVGPWVPRAGRFKRIAGGQTLFAGEAYANAGAAQVVLRFDAANGLVGVLANPGGLAGIQDVAASVDDLRVGGFTSAGADRQAAVGRLDAFGNAKCSLTCAGRPHTDCDDTNPCVSRTCSAAKGCVAAAALDGANCSDGVACTVGDACASGSCKAGKSGLGETLWNVGIGPDGLTSVLAVGADDVVVVGAAQIVGKSAEGYAARVRPDGERVWSETTGTASNELFHGVAQLSDGRVVAVGQTLVGTNSSGWRRIVGPGGGAEVVTTVPNQNVELRAVVADGGGGVAVGAAGTSAFFERFGEDLKTQSVRQVSGGAFAAVARGTDGRIAATGAASSQKLLLAVLSPAGTVAMERRLHIASTTSTQGTGIAAAPQGWVVVGSTSTGAAKKSSGLVAGVDAVGEVLWSRTYGTGAGAVEFATIRALQDGFVVAGVDQDSKAGKKLGIAASLDGGGTVRWQRLLGPVQAGSWTQLVADVAVTNQGTVVAVGTSDQKGGPDSWLARLDAWGNATCEKNSCATKAATDCDDKNPCTADTCVASIGCVNLKTTGGTCDDGKACTSGTSCNAGVCSGGGQRLLSADTKRDGAHPPAALLADGDGFAAVLTKVTNSAQTPTVVRLNAAGVQQSYLPPTGGSGRVAGAVALPGGDVVIASMTGAPDEDGVGAKVRISRLDRAGNAVWSQQQAFAYDRHLIHGLNRLADGRFVVTGETAGKSTARPFVIVVSADGASADAELVEGHGVSASCWRAADRPGGLWLACRGGADKSHPFVVATNAAGKTVFARNHDAEKATHVVPIALQAEDDGGAWFALIRSTGPALGPYVIELRRIAPDGSLRFAHRTLTEYVTARQFQRAVNGDWIGVVGLANGADALTRFDARLRPKFTVASATNFSIRRYLERPNGDIALLSTKGANDATNAHKLEVLDRWGNRTCAAGGCPDKALSDCDDGSGCLGRTCDPSAGCASAKAADKAAMASVGCDDGRLCTGDGACKSGKCDAGKPSVFAAATDTLSGGLDDEATGALRVGDGDWIVGGWRKLNGGKFAPTALRYGADGSIAWQREYPQAQTAQAYGACGSAGNSGFYTFGYVGNAKTEGLVLRHNINDGSVEWTGKITHASAVSVRGAAVLGNGDVIAVGDVDGGQKGLRSTVRASDGKATGFTEDNGIHWRAVVAAPGNAGYFAAGGNLFNSELTTVRVDAHGKQLWSHAHTLISTQKYARGAAAVGDDGWAVIASQTNQTSQKLEPVVWRLGVDGALRWKLVVPVSAIGHGHAIATLADGTIAAAYSEDTAGSGVVTKIAALSGHGLVLRTTTSESHAIQQPRALIPTAAGGWLVAGMRRATANATKDVWLEVTDALGQTSCAVGSKCSKPTPAGCDDQNACTIDTCTAKAGCEHVAAPLAFCDDGEACTDDACDPKSGCVQTPNGGECTSCAVLHRVQPSLPSGLYVIDPTGSNAFSAWCDMRTRGGGWTLVEAVDANNRDAYVGKDFDVDFPRAKDTPGFDDYRLEKATITALFRRSSEVHARCHRVYGASGDDWLFGDVSVLSRPFLGTNLHTSTTSALRVTCAVAGQSCSKYDLSWSHSYKSAGGGQHPHADMSQGGWPIKAVPGGLDAFGYHNGADASHLCHSSDGELVWMVR